MKIKLLVLLIILFCSTTANAKVQIINKDASPLDVSTSIVFIDNINPTLTENLSATGVILKPKGQLVMDGEGMQVLFDYEAKLERFKLSEDSLLLDDKQNFDSFRIKLYSRFFVAQAWHVDLDLQHLDQTQRYGNGISSLRTEVLEADQLKRNRAAVTLVYGNDTANRYISMSAFVSDDRYEDHNQYSTLFDLTEQGLQADIAFKQSVASSLLLKIGLTEEDFVSQARDDSRVYNALAGMAWQPSGKTKVEALIGMYWRESINQDATSGLSWSLDYTAKPNEDWLVQVKSARFSGVSKSELTSSSVEQNVGLVVTYKASDRWFFGANITSGQTTFDEADQVSKLEEVKGGITATVMLKAHSKLMFKVGVNEQLFSDEILDYSQNEVGLTWQVNL